MANAIDGNFLAIFLLVWTLALIDEKQDIVDARPIEKRSVTGPVLCGNPPVCQCLQEIGLMDCSNRDLSHLPTFRMMNQIGVKTLLLNQNSFKHIPFFNKRWWKSLEEVKMMDNPICDQNSPVKIGNVVVELDQCAHTTEGQTRTEVGGVDVTPKNDTLPPWWVPPFDPFYFGDDDDDGDDDDRNDDDYNDNNDGNDDGNDDTTDPSRPQQTTADQFDDAYYGRFIPDNDMDYVHISNNDQETMEDNARVKIPPRSTTTTRTTGKPHVKDFMNNFDFGHLNTHDQSMYLLISICISTPFMASAVIYIMIAICKKCAKCLKKWRGQRSCENINMSMNSILNDQSSEIDNSYVQDDSVKPGTSKSNGGTPKKKRNMVQDIDMNEPSKLRNGKERKMKDGKKENKTRKDKESDTEDEDEDEVVFGSMDITIFETTAEQRVRMRSTSVERDL